jgi:hypothetical protein
MKGIDQYHRWVEWSDEDQVCVGKCPNLISGIQCGDPLKVYEELGDVVQEVIDHFQQSGRPLPAPRTRPMMEVSSRPTAGVASVGANASIGSRLIQLILQSHE